jgi:hypothetical protein
MMQALNYLQANAERFQIDADRICHRRRLRRSTDRRPARCPRHDPRLRRGRRCQTHDLAPQPRGLVLACGPYDLGLLAQTSTPAGRRFIKAIMWAYSGKRNSADDPVFATLSVTDNVTSAFPPALITVGNADPLRPHSELLAEKLRAHGVELETLFWPDDHQPPLGHEYQFYLDSDAAQLFLERLLTFLRQRLGATPPCSFPAPTEARRTSWRQSPTRG